MNTTRPPMTPEQWQAAWDRCHRIEAGLLQARDTLDAERTQERWRREAAWRCLGGVAVIEALIAAGLVFYASQLLQR